MFTRFHLLGSKFYIRVSIKSRTNLHSTLQLCHLGSKNNEILSPQLCIYLKIELRLGGGTFLGEKIMYTMAMLAIFLTFFMSLWVAVLNRPTTEANASVDQSY